MRIWTAPAPPQKEPSAVPKATDEPVGADEPPRELTAAEKEAAANAEPGDVARLLDELEQDEPRRKPRSWTTRTKQSLRGSWPSRKRQCKRKRLVNNQFRKGST
jgi:hypothetical protein